MKTNLYLLFALTLFSSEVSAQKQSPVSWQFSSSAITSSVVLLTLKASMKPGWHIYSQHLAPDGPLPTKFTFTKSSDYSLIGDVNELSKAHTLYDSTFLMDIIWFNDSAIFTRKIKLNVAEAVIKGKVEFMACTEEMCLPPEEVFFEIVVKKK